MTLPRVLVADDQADIQQALRLLLSDAGFDTELVGSVEAVMDRLGAGGYDLLLMDLNYTRDTTSGKEGLELINRIPRARCRPADCRHDGLGHHRHGRRGHAARRPQLRPEALGRHDSGRHRRA
jgi:CheY-like chemotaxis protein